MAKPNYRQIYAIKKKNEERIKQLCPDATHKSGIYCFHREDENGFKYAYVGLATKSVLSRCAEHLSGYTQHIDRSLKSHKLYDKENPYGWKLDILCFCSAEECNEKEQFYIKKAHQSGRQLLNATTGSQGKGKKALGDAKSPKGYYDGKLQGEKQLAKQLKHIIDTHLVITLKKETKTSQKALEKFYSLLDK